MPIDFSVVLFIGFPRSNDFYSGQVCYFIKIFFAQSILFITFFHQYIMFANLFCILLIFFFF